MQTHLDTHIRAIFFDHDDTLVGSIEAKWAQDKHIALTHYNKVLTDDEIRQHWGKPFRELLSIYFETDDIEQAIAYSEQWNAHYPKKVFATTITTLRHLHELGKLIGIVTSNTRSNLMSDLADQNVPLKILDYTQTADDTSFHKPDPLVFIPAISWLHEHGIQPQEVLYIGDSLQDMQASLGAGFNFIGVETGIITAEEFAVHGAKSIPSLDHLVRK
jgi:HAD superfamily hydrolase (TIGR01549 family)